MSEAHEREQAIFDAALGMPTADRAAYLDRATEGDPALRERMEMLLKGFEVGTFLERAGVSTLRRTMAGPIPLREKPGDGIGRYKLLQQIGEGGCGVVYMAEQEEPVRRRVALKIIKLGMDTRSVIARFEAERQALALMDHPNIAKVFDAGATDTGRPYFVMELIRGVKITEYCDEKKLSTPERLDLFIKVCSAVQHAHQKGVIHRDLKPSNILVSMDDGLGVPKVIDFGVAKATTGQPLTDKTVFTAFEQFIGTPAYMSPEQVLMTNLDVDTRSDIYSLGILLYELLTGTTPFDPQELLQAGLDEMRWTIREKEPARPSTRVSTLGADESTTAAKCRGLDTPKLAGLLRGDLDWIVMKCLEKDRARRYETANGLARDIERHLKNEAVLAGPPTTAYKVQKFIKRHRKEVFFATVLTLGLVAGVIAQTLSVFRAKRAEYAARQAQHLADAERAREVLERQRADEQAAIARAVSDFLQNDLLKQAGSVAQGDQGFTAQPDLTVREALRRASEKVGQRFTNQAPVEAEIQHTLGIALLELGEWERAIHALERAVVLVKQTAGPGAAQTLRAMRHLARAYSRGGRFTEAVALSEETLKITKAKSGPDNPETLASMEELANAYAEAGKYTEEVELCEEVLKLSKAKLGPRDSVTLRRMNNLALAYRDAGRVGESLSVQEETVELAKIILGPDHLNTLNGMANLAAAYKEAGRWTEAIRLLQESLTIYQARFGGDHPDTLRTMNALALSYQGAGLMSQALPLQEQTLKLVRAKLGSDHPDTLINMNNLASDYREVGRVSEAVSLSEETLRLTRNKFGSEHPASIRSMHNLALAYKDAGRPADALPLDEQTVKLAMAKLGMEHPYSLGSIDSLLGSYQAASRPMDAERFVQEVVTPAIASNGQAAGLLRVRASYFARRGHWKEAAADLARVIELKPEGAEDWHSLAATLIQTRELEKYREHCRKSLARFAQPTDSVMSFRIATDCLILPSSGTDLELVYKMADNSLLAGTNNSRWAMFACVKALAEYRQSRFADAVKWAERALSFHPTVPCPCWPPGRQAEAVAVLAMGRYQLGQDELAHAALASGEEILENKLPKLESGDLGAGWLDWIFSHALVREAQALMGATANDRPHIK